MAQNHTALSDVRRTHLLRPLSAEKGSAIAAYNAALMRLEGGTDGDGATTLSLLERGVALGDAKSSVRIDAERARK